MGLRKQGTVVVLDVINQRIKAGDVQKLVYITSVLDRQKYGFQYVVPGTAGSGPGRKKFWQDSILDCWLDSMLRPCRFLEAKELRATPSPRNGRMEMLKC